MMTNKTGNKQFEEYVKQHETPKIMLNHDEYSAKVEIPIHPFTITDYTDDERKMMMVDEFNKRHELEQMFADKARREMDKIRLEIPIAPVPASRPRFRRNGHTYDAKKYRDFKLTVKSWLIHHTSGRLIKNTSLTVKYEFYRPIQSSISKKEHHRRAINAVKPVTKPDVDNYVKAMQDCLVGTVIEDDNIITDISASKRYSEKPRIVITISKTEM
jgi:Holliday junction resolvase RusA-like endonuclease